MPTCLAQIESLPLLVAGWLVVAAIIVVALVSFRAARLRLRSAKDVRDCEVQLLREKILTVREERRVHEGRAEGWKGFANFVVDRKHLHGDSGICSFYLRPLNEQLKLPAFFPGQHLVFQVPSESGGSPLTRRYSLSDAPGRDYFRVSVKLALPPPKEPSAPLGKGSSYFHQQLCAESENRSRCHLLVKAPQGEFHLNPLQAEPVVLIGSGVGVTPVLSMFNAILDQNPERETWFFYGVRNSDNDILFDAGVLHSDFAELCEKHANLHLKICYSKPLEQDAALLESRPELYSPGRVSIDVLKEHLPSSNFRYFLCGPDAMMNQLEDDLAGWDVPEEHIHSERFGPPPPKSGASGSAAEGMIAFAQSGKTIAFGAEDSCLLDAAERAGVPISNDCRAGSCGECKTAIVSGEVTYPRKTSFKCPPGYCLTCSCLPKGDVTLDC